jgi:hypothetical protein
MDNNTVINMIPKALEELLYSQEWKDLEVTCIYVESEKNLSIEWRDLTDIDDKVHDGADNCLKLYIDDSGLHLDCLWEYIVWNVSTCYTYSPEKYVLFINYLVEKGPQLIREFADSIEYIDKKEHSF